MQAIKKSVSVFWGDAERLKEIKGLAQGKESGHRIADYVDDKTTSFIHAHYPAAFEKDKAGKITKRSMGDIWIKEGGIYHPVNIKTGMSNSGQPNMVALRKLLKCILQNQIDSYYLLMVKFVSGDLKAPAIYFVDMLNWLDYLAFDSGPGQIMLKSESFFADFKSHKVVSRNLPQKADFLMDMLKEGDRKLLINRKEKSEHLQKMIANYKRRKNFTISAADQAVLNLLQI